MNPMKPLTEEAANEVWDLLVELGEAPKREDSRRHFVQLQTQEFIREWRFQGMFAFGGKFYRDGNKWRVDYYIENQTTERDKVRGEMNVKLDDLYRKYMGEEPWKP